MKLLILPIEVSDSEKLRAVYCTEEVSPVSIELDHKSDISSFSTIRKFYNTLGVEDLDQNLIFKLGKVDDAVCYAVNITGLNHSHKLKRIPFHRILDGDYSDSKLLSCCFLAISYFA